MRAPPITVLLAVFNGSAWLPAAIESVLSQTLGDFEFILIDDGSSDDSPAIVSEYARLDKRIVSVSKSNTGLTDSLNVGLARARGEWIARIDADDLCEPTRLAEQLQFLRRHSEIGLLGCDVTEIDHGGDRLGVRQYPSRHGQLLRRLERLLAVFPHSSAIFRRELATSIGGYNPWYLKSQDWDLWLRIAERSKIGSLPCSLVRIRRHSAQISSSTRGKSQLVYATAGSTCHYLRLSGSPLLPSDEAAWRRFQNWIERRLGELHAVERRELWNRARGRYFSAVSRAMGIVGVASALLHSRHTPELLYERAFGSGLPRRLANEWMSGESQKAEA